MNLLHKLFGSPNERKVKSLDPLVDQINDFEAELQKLSDEDLRRKTQQFRQELANRERSDNDKKDYKLEQDMLELLLPEAFAVVREAGRRVLNMRHFDVQMIGGIVLHRGGISEMRTGEGKTLVATLPAYLNALTGKGVHVVTVNDYLAKRDAEWMGKIYEFLGLNVGLVLSNQRGMNLFAEKKAAYAADITYGTNNEFGFDYLRDNMAGAKSHLCQRPFNFAIIDEVDSILIDEARTPLIISGRLEQSAETYMTLARIAPLLKPEQDYTIDEKAKNVILTEDGIDKAQELLQVNDLFDPKQNMAHYLLCALKAKELYKRDIEYVVKNDEVVIVDEFTGRLMEGRRWSDGLHQAVEAKEGVRIQDETQTLASITFQNLFRLYPKLSGMTGTAMTEEAEFGKIYNLEVTAIPTNRDDVRLNHPDVIYKNEKVKYFRVVDEIIECHLQGRPVLVGTTSIERSEWISHLLTTPDPMIQYVRERVERLLTAIRDGGHQEWVEKLLPVLQAPENADADTVSQLASESEKTLGGDTKELLQGLSESIRSIHAIRKGIPHSVLNAKHHEQEAQIVAQAGRSGAVTIATNMAGRGTDILLGGNPESLARAFFAQQGEDWRSVHPELYQAQLDQCKKITEEDKEKVVALGGLHIIGTERHESRRIDNQLRGRAARQGDPGSTRFYLSLEDSLMRLFGGQKLSGMMDFLKVDETFPITHPWVSRAIEGAQRKVEAYHFDIRKNILKYDDVLTEQRKLIYAQRRRVLDGNNLRESVEHMIEQEMERMVAAYVSADTAPGDISEESLDELLTNLHATIPQLTEVITAERIKPLAYNDIVLLVKEEAQNVYHRMESDLTNLAAELHQQHGITLMGLDDEDNADIPTTEAPVADSDPVRNHPMRRIERDILLSIIDAKWIDYLHNLDALREGIGLRAYGQKDPLIEYKREAFEMFQNLTYEIQRETLQLLFRARIEVQLERQMDMEDGDFLDEPLTALEAEAMAAASSPAFSPEGSEGEAGGFPFNHQASTITRGASQATASRPDGNEECPCGSGKRFSKCHGA